MIYSKRLQQYVPITVEKVVYENPNYRQITKYIVKDNKIPVGRVSVSDMPNGAYVEFIENFHPNLYGGFGKVADQIEVEHCLCRGLDNFEIYSNAALSSHALHYKRGKRFIPEEVNEIVKKIIENTPVGEKYNTSFLGGVRMFMPQEIIKKYLEIIKKSPLLK